MSEEEGKSHTGLVVFTVLAGSMILVAGLVIGGIGPFAASQKVTTTPVLSFEVLNPADPATGALEQISFTLMNWPVGMAYLIEGPPTSAGTPIIGCSGVEPVGGGPVGCTVSVSWPNCPAYFKAVNSVGLDLESNSVNVCG